MPNLDEFLAKLEQDDREDRRLITPIEYGRLRGIRPQRVYRAIRDHKLATEWCDCGRKCISKEEADALFGFAKEASEVASEEEES
jgi:hypothetical protein